MDHPQPRDETLVSLARVLGVNPEEMFERVGRYNKRPRTRESLRRASAKRAGRERIEDPKGRLLAQPAGGLVAAVSP